MRRNQRVKKFLLNEVLSMIFGSRLKKSGEYLIKKLVVKSGYELVYYTDLRKEDQYLDRSEFRYILWLDRIYQKISTVPGHIVEIGVARGRNSIIFGNLIMLNGDDEVRRYYGFDTFEGYREQDLESSRHLSRDAWKYTTAKFVRKRLQSASLSRICSIIQGDVKETAPVFLNQGSSDRHQPGHLRVALLYVDCNAYLPSLTAMEDFKDYMSPGGVICIDEKMQGGETRALIDFCKRHNLEFVKDPSPFSVPAYTVIRE